MVRAYCTEHHNDWDVGLPFLLFAVRDSVQESMGFIPNEYVFGHTVRGPLKLIKDKCLFNKEDGDVCKYVIDMKNKLASACKTAKSHLLESQDDMKRQYDRKSVPREFEIRCYFCYRLLVVIKSKVPGSVSGCTMVGGLNSEKN